MQIYNHVIYPSYLIKKQRNADDLCHAFKTITPAHSDLTRLMTPVVEMWREVGMCQNLKRMVVPIAVLLQKWLSSKLRCKVSCNYKKRWTDSWPSITMNWSKQLHASILTEGHFCPPAPNNSGNMYTDIDGYISGFLYTER